MLLVDDDPLVLRALGRSIARFAEVVTANSGEDALRTLREDAAFDVVFCDMQMPGMTGLEVRAALGREAPALLARFVVMTGDPTQVGDVRRLAKPASAADIQAVLFSPGGEPD